MKYINIFIELMKSDYCVILNFQEKETLDWENFCEIVVKLLLLIWLKNTIFDNKTRPGINIILDIKKLLYFPQQIYYIFVEKSMLCNMSITSHSRDLSTFLLVDNDYHVIISSQVNYFFQ